MTPCFADTFYFLAMLNAADEGHARAMSMAQTLRRPLVTTTWVLTEVADALADTANRELFPVFLSRLRSDPRMTIVAASDELFDRGVELYEDRPDKEWSLTDCISFVVMSDRGISEALTADHHFEQAGFTILLG